MQICSGAVACNKFEKFKSYAAMNNHLLEVAADLQSSLNGSVANLVSEILDLVSPKYFGMT